MALAAAATSLHHPVSHFLTPRSHLFPAKLRRGVVRCSDAPAIEVAAENRKAVVKNGNDSLEICRVLNGMWQTSGGWGRIDRNDAVEAMLGYADSGLSTFDMADHCMLFYFPALTSYLKVRTHLWSESNTVVHLKVRTRRPNGYMNQSQRDYILLKSRTGRACFTNELKCRMI